jgi:squalene cyclase
LKFPHEIFGARIEEMREYQPKIVKMVHELIEAVEAEDPTFTNLANSTRQTKTYRVYPKSLGDENRLFMTISSYFERFRHRFEGKNGNEQFDEFVKLVKQDRA